MIFLDKDWNALRLCHKVTVSLYCSKSIKTAHTSCVERFSENLDKKALFDQFYALISKV